MATDIQRDRHRHRWGQGYENESNCREMADKIIGGHYRDADKKVIRPKRK